MTPLEELIESLKHLETKYENWNVIRFLLRNEFSDLNNDYLLCLETIYYLLVDSKRNRYTQYSAYTTLCDFIKLRNHTNAAESLLMFVTNTASAFNLSVIIQVFDTCCCNCNKNDFLIKLLSRMDKDSYVYKNCITKLFGNSKFTLVGIYDVIVKQISKCDDADLITFVSNQMGNYYEYLNNSQRKYLLELLYNKDRHAFTVTLSTLYNRFNNNRDYYDFWNGVNSMFPINNGITSQLLYDNCPELDTVFRWLNL